MKNCAICMLLILVTGGFVMSPASAGGRHVLQMSASSASGATAVSTGGGQADARATATSFGGEAIAEAFASSEVVEEAKSILLNVYNQVVDKADLGNCTDVIITAETEVTAQAEAVASVYTNTIGTVTVEGEGEACAEASASGEAAASAFAQATAAAVAEASGDSSDATAEAIVTAISAGTARAFADAFSSACTTGGFGLAEQESFAQAIVQPLVEVYAIAFGGASCGEEARAASEAIGEGTSTVEEDVVAETTTNTVAQGETQAQAGGSADATTEQAETIEDINAIKIQSTETICSFPFTTCCTRRFSNADTCNCSLNPQNGRCDAKKISSPSEEQIAWEDTDGSICKCRR